MLLGQDAQAVHRALPHVVVFVLAPCYELRHRVIHILCRTCKQAGHIRHVSMLTYLCRLCCQAPRSIETALLFLSSSFAKD